MQKKVKKTKNCPSLTKFRKVIPRPDVLHSFLKHSDVNQYLDYLGHRYSDFVKVHVLGRSYEGRLLKAIEIDWFSPKNLLSLASKNPRVPHPRVNSAQSNSTPQNITVPVQGRNIVFIEGGTHGREWISICVALNCIFQLTEKCMRHLDLLRKLRFYIVPVTNPDGYEYSRTKNRRWRKNRRPQKHCKSIGTDCNRNYDFQWAAGNSKAHRNTYKGDKPFSEPETCALRNVLNKMAPNLLFVLSLHSYAQSIMYPWGYSKELPDTWQQLKSLATAGRNAIKSYSGRVYRVGSIAGLTKRIIPGSFVDYAFGALNVPLALVMELPSPEFGFQPPAEAISPIGHESWFGIREMCKCAYDLSPPIVFPHLGMALKTDESDNNITNASDNSNGSSDAAAKSEHIAEDHPDSSSSEPSCLISPSSTRPVFLTTTAAPSRRPIAAGI